MGKFNKDLAKKIQLQTALGGGCDGPADSQGIEIKSPGKMYWFTIKGESIDEKTLIDEMVEPSSEQESNHLGNPRLE